jgi:hypothetical protein
MELHVITNVCSEYSEQKIQANGRPYRECCPIRPCFGSLKQNALCNNFLSSYRS